MLLEVLSDFQISIPELGVIEARTRPIVVLTSNNSRELTEALKRRCLYLWLDYPEVEREMEIVRLHSPELDEKLARRLVEVVHMVRALDLKKPPSIAESIDWARALLLLGADDIDREVFEQTMSIIVKHRSDLELVAERVGVKLGEEGKLDLGRRGPAAERAWPPRPREARGAPPGSRRGSSPSARSCEARASRSAPRRSSTRSRRSRRCPGPSREDFRETLAATLAKSQEDRRVFELLFDRYFFRAAEAEALRQRDRRAAPRGDRAARPRRAARGGAPGDRRRARRRDARPRAAGDRGLRPPRRGLGRGRRGRAADPPHARPPDAGRAADADGEVLTLDRESLNQFERHLRRELERRPDRAHRASCRPRGRWPSSTARCRPAPPRTSPRCTARSRSSRSASRRSGTSSAGRRRGAAVDVRRTMRASLETGGVPLRLEHRPKRPRRPEIYVLCDVSTSVTSASVFFLSVLHALHDSFRKLRSFVFIERISEVTDVFEPERDFRSISERDQPRGRGRRRLGLHRLRPRLARVPERDLGGARPALDGDRARRRAHQRPRAARRRLRPGRRARRAHLLAQPRAEALLELRRLGHGGLRAALRRRLRVLDDQAPRDSSST